MNRIYQGKVTAVEILDGKEPKPFDSDPKQAKEKWQAALWQHHQLFQDAVNYYTLALAAMAGGLKPADDTARDNEIKRLNNELDSLAQQAKNAKDEAAKGGIEKKEQQVKEKINRLEREDAIWLWREQVRKAWEEGVERDARRFKWERETIARVLKKLDPGFDALKASFDLCCDAVLKLSQATPGQRADCLLALIEDANARDLNQVGVEQVRALCSSKTKAGDAVMEAAQIAKRIEAAKVIHSASSQSLAITAAKIEIAVFCKTPPKPNEAYRGKQALAKISARFKALHKAEDGEPAPFPELANHQAEFVQAMEARLVKEGDDFQFPKVFKPAGMFNAVAVFAYWPKEVTWKIARGVTTSLITRTAPIVYSDPCAEARVGNKPVFDYFTNLAMWKVKPKNDAAWFEFDLAAFVEALKTPHRYCQDTVKRKQECARLEERLNKMRGAGEGGGDGGEEETSARLPGFAGDHRIDSTIPGKKGIKQLIHDTELTAYLEDEDAGDDDGYGINENTLRGWSELRRKWREAAQKPEFAGKENEAALLKDLDSIRRNEQGDRPEESGSGPLFKRLQLPEYHNIWKDPPPNPDVHDDDPLGAWVRYRELQEDLRKTSEPIRFTPAHPTESPRFFSFPKQNRPKAKAPGRGEATPGQKSDHLPGMFAYDDDVKLVQVQGDEPWLKDRPRFMAFNAGLVRNTAAGLQPTSVRIYFSAPRLRRDRIRSDTEQSLGSVSLLQPMLEALGLSTDVPEVNFANCPITLLAERRERLNERAADEPEDEEKKPERYDLNLAFPVTLNAEKLKNQPLFQHGQRWALQPYTNKKTKARIQRHAQFNFSGDDDLREISLRWPVDRERHPRKSDPVSAWYEALEQFSCLSVDLGQREGGAYALLDVQANADFGKNRKGKPVPSRFIGQTGKKQWRVALAMSGLFKLPGEDAILFRPRTQASTVRPSPDDRNAEDKNPGKDFREELWGERGRPALRKTDPGAVLDETEDACRILSEFDQMGIMTAGWDDPQSPAFLSFPEQNDKLIVAARRFLSRVRRLHRWCAFLSLKNWPGKPDTASQKRKRALEEIREACGLDENGVQKFDEKTGAPLDGEAWLAPAVKKLVLKEADDSVLSDALEKVLQPMLDHLPSLFVDMANRCAPLRGRSWRWTEHAKSTPLNPLHILLPTGNPRPNARMKERAVTWIRGQRGLSMKRIGQLEDVRRLFQSLNQIQRRKIGILSPRRKRGEKGDELPDCCPKLLEKLEEVKEQRVNQLAHKILALALGLRLKKSGPIKSGAEREHCNIHGEYERIPDSTKPDDFRRPVDFIVLEDLKYYETTRMRSRQVNVRLMRWCRRHFRDKLKQLCEVFGIPVVETNPANSSKFCARTGVAGFRAVEIGPGFQDEYVWRKALEKLGQYQSGKKKLEPDDLAFCEGASRLMQQVKEAQQIPTKSGKALTCPRTLLAPLGSGNMFVPIVGEVKAADLPPVVVQADVNAAINLGLRVIADPQLWEIHPRVRTKRPEEKKKTKQRGGSTSATAVQNPTSKQAPPNLLVAEKRKFGDAEIKLDLTNVPKGSAIEDSRKPNYFRDLAGLADNLRKLPEPGDSQAKRSLEFTRLLVTRDKVLVPESKASVNQVELLSSKAFWLSVKKLQWQRCLAINDARLAAWRNKLDPMPD